MVLVIAYFTFSQCKNFLVTQSLYLLLVASAIMALHLPFLRYLIIALPSSAVIFSTTIKHLLIMHNWARGLALALISMFAISSALVLPYMNSLKPPARLADDKWSYLTHVFEEADAWKWINEHAPINARIATFDIKEYYIQRDIMQLDGNESTPLYKMDNIEEAIYFLKDRGVTHVLSVPWTSPMDPRMPKAYEWCVLTRYLGDPRYLPPVYVGVNGTTVYQVGPIDEKTIYESFAQKGFAPPIKHATINITTTNNMYPYIGKLYLPIPVDYREGLLVVSVNSCRLIDVELWNGLIPAEMITNPSEGFMFVKKWSIGSGNGSNVKSISFEWQIDKAGYFTFRIIDKGETPIEDFNITLDLRFYNYWELKFL